jgi:phosphatidate cytidylyltransferase
MRAPALRSHAPPAPEARRSAGSDVFSRLAVAIAGLPLVLGTVWLGGWWLFALALVTGLIGLHEFVLVTRTLRPITVAAYAGLVSILLGIELGGLRWGIGGLFVALLLAFVLKGLGDTRGSATVSVGTTGLGVGWIGFGLGYVLLLRDISADGRLAALTVLIAVFAADTAAYLAGRVFGRHKLAPRLSPGKTWEGFVVGAAAAVLTTWIALYKTGFLPGGRSLVLGAAIALAAPAGDLFESGLKREMQVKDTGRLLGGHGGVLDRIDSLLFASIAAFYVILAFGAA